MVLIFWPCGTLAVSRGNLFLLASVKSGEDAFIQRSAAVAFVHGLCFLQANMSLSRLVSHDSLLDKWFTFWHHAAASTIQLWLQAPWVVKGVLVQSVAHIEARAFAILVGWGTNSSPPPLFFVSFFILNFATIQRCRVVRRNECGKGPQSFTRLGTTYPACTCI